MFGGLVSFVRCGCLVCLVILGFDIFGTYKEGKRQTIKVLGLADKVVISDHCSIVIRISEVGSCLQTVVNKIERTKNSVMSFISENGIEKSLITDLGNNVEDKVKYIDNVNLNFRYNVTSTIKFETDDVENMRDKCTSLYKSYPNVHVDINYSCKNFDNISHQLIESAVSDAHERAELIARVSKLKLTKALSITTRKINILDADNYSGEWNDGERSYKKRVRLVVDATYSCK